VLWNRRYARFRLERGDGEVGPPRSARALNRATNFLVRARQMGSEIGNASKVPEVTLGFWIIKIAATTLGETPQTHCF
jgi:hypothetical protein